MSLIELTRHLPAASLGAHAESVDERTAAHRASPKGCRTVAGGNTPGTTPAQRTHPGGGAGAVASDKSFVEFDHVPAQKLQVFFAKSSRSVMFLLPLDVAADGCNLRMAHREYPVTVLPRESAVSEGS